MSLEKIVKDVCDEFAIEAASIRYSINTDRWTVHFNWEDRPRKFEITGMDAIQGDKHIERICSESIRQILLGQA